MQSALPPAQTASLKWEAVFIFEDIAAAGIVAAGIVAAGIAAAGIAAAGIAVTVIVVKVIAAVDIAVIFFRLRSLWFLRSLQKNKKVICINKKSLQCNKKRGHKTKWKQQYKIHRKIKQNKK